MEKDAYYFPHFCNARHDRKIKRVRKELGIEGYGIFFMLLETLREQADYRYPVSDIDLLADEYRTSEQKVRAVISNYDLFQYDGNENFFSSNLIMYLTPYLEGKERKRIAGIKGNLIRYGYHTKEELENKTPEEIQALGDKISHASHSDRLPIAQARKGKERKRKEIKGNNIKTATPQPPAVQGKALSPMKNPIANHYQSLLTRIQPASTWGDFGKERQQLNTLAKKTAALLGDTPYEDEQKLATDIVGTFVEMRQAGHWRAKNKPVIPSSVSNAWPDIITQIADNQRYEDIDFSDVLF